jgi:hypothetical protein
MSAEDEIEVVVVAEDGEGADEGETAESAPAHEPPGPYKMALLSMVGKFCVNYLPFLLKECKFGSRHWAWQRVCPCGFGTLINPDEEGGWHGGVLDMKLGHELTPCAHCHPELSPHHHQWALTLEEESLVQAWRAYRGEVLDAFGETHPYKYELFVRLGGAETFIMGRRQGLQPMTGKGILADAPKLGKAKADKPN